MPTIPSLRCSVPDCSSPVRTKGFCKLHYQRVWRVGSPHVSRPCLRLSTPAKFRFYAVISEDPDSCWGWRGFTDRGGYGKMRVGNTNISAHRVSWTLHMGPIPQGKMVLHRCNNEPCSNPRHLYLGDHLDNMADRLTAGHYLSGEAHFGVKLSDRGVQEVRSSTGTYKQIAKRFGISASQVGNIRRGDQRKQATARVASLELPILLLAERAEDAPASPPARIAVEFSDVIRGCTQGKGAQLFKRFEADVAGAAANRGAAVSLDEVRHPPSLEAD